MKNFGRLARLALLLILLPSMALAAPKNFFIGDSITARASLVGTNYADWFSQQRGEVSVDLAVAGSCIADQVNVLYQNPPSHANGDAYFMMIGVNDLGPIASSGRGYGAGALTIFRGTYESNLYWMGGITRTARDASFTYTPIHWLNNDSIGTYSMTAGATVLIPFGTDVFALSYLIKDGYPGTVSVTIDGVSKGTFVLDQPAGTTINTWYLHQDRTPVLMRIPGNGAGSHTAVITLVSGLFMPEFVWDGPSGVPTYAMTILRMAPPAVGTDAGVAAYNGVIANAVALSAGDGNNTRLIDSSAAIDPRFDLDAGGIHPWLRSHRKILPLQPN